MSNPSVGCLFFPMAAVSCHPIDVVGANTNLQHRIACGVLCRVRVTRKPCAAVGTSSIRRKTMGEEDNGVDAVEGISGALKFKSKLKKKHRDKLLADHGLGLHQKDDDSGDPRGFVCEVETL